MLHKHCKQIGFTIWEIIFGKLFQLTIHSLTAHIRWISNHSIISLCKDPRLMNIRNKRFRCSLLLVISFLFQAIQSIKKRLQLSFFFLRHLNQRTQRFGIHKAFQRAHQQLIFCAFGMG
ncbi:Uncharacterised protein [Klebsiella michiganensis]|uniref:Uncharacterized protein n=1 Tax=Klebsiella michiganensis TaxID=1134687 RepID=A0A7H4PQD5_9ENTR|nr:Uncharacterised protein [Klebsiella michiganensis]